MEPLLAKSIYATEEVHLSSLFISQLEGEKRIVTVNILEKKKSEFQIYVPELWRCFSCMLCLDKIMVELDYYKCHGSGQCRIQRAVVSPELILNRGEIAF